MFGKSKRIAELEQQNRELQEQLKKSNEVASIFDKFQDSFPISFFSISPEKKILNFNHEFVKLTGFSNHEIAQSNGAAAILWSINPSECKVCKLVVEFMNKKISGNGTAYIVTKSGEEVPVYVYVIPIVNDGVVVRVYILLRDQRPEIVSRKEYMIHESKPIIDMLQNIVNGKLDQELHIDDASELKILEKPVNDIRENLNNITQQITSSTNRILEMTTKSDESLSQTTLAIDELTDKISQNTQDITDMGTHTNNVTKSLKDEVELANKTVSSMDQINDQVILINDSISVIDQIAFQTNILSLNAAVEAATAGEAGKGFAVVAQEVRNLASRSAEAANEIKKIVDIATQKADDGKNISQQMIAGFNLLNESINNMAEIINHVTKSSQEQHQNIQNINAAIKELSLQIKQSAEVTDSFKNETFEILHV